MEFTFKLSEAEAQKVLDALLLLPYGEVFEVINTIQTQAIEQRNQNESNVNPFDREAEDNGI